MNICLFTEEECTRIIPRKDERAEHIIKVLHKNTGDSFDAGIIGGKAGKATITNISNDGISFSFVPESDGKPLYPLTLIIGFPRPIQLRRLLRDVAGLGAEQVILVGTELGEKSYLKSNVVQDGGAYQMLLDGTAQAASTHIPELSVEESLEKALSRLQDFAPDSALVALDNRRATNSLSKWLNQTNPNKVVAAIGSERGWTEHERDILERYGFTLCSMGTRVLRTETATTVASSIILDKFGVLN